MSNDLPAEAGVHVPNANTGLELSKSSLAPALADGRREVTRPLLALIRQMVGSASLYMTL